MMIPTNLEKAASDNLGLKEFGILGSSIGNGLLFIASIVSFHVTKVGPDGCHELRAARGTS